MSRFLLYIIAVIALSMAAYFVYVHAPRLQLRAVQGAAQDTPVDTGEQVIHEETSQYVIDITYRHFGIAVVDARVDARMQEVVASFKKDVAQVGPPQGVVQQYTLTGDVSEYQTDSQIASERINLYEYTGGAHGLPFVLTLNYHIETGEEVTLDEALALTGLTLKDVSSKALAQLTQEYGVDSIFADGVDPKPENYGTFLIGPFNVTFVFQAYQVVAYAAGMPEISFARK